MIFSWQQIPSPLVSEIMCKNFDGVVLDCEHGSFSRETLTSCLQVIKLSKKKAFVRLTEISKTEIRHCLDTGADGLIFSTVETEEQCRKIKDFCYFNPRGSRGLGLVRQNFWGNKKLIQKDPIIIPQIETKLSVDNLSSIIKHNFDYYLIGPYDLSLSLGSPGDFNNYLFLDCIKKINELIDSKKLAVHIPDKIDKEVEKFHNYGLKCLGMDTVAILEFNKRSIEDAKF